MKKMIVLCSALLALGLTACSGSGSNNGGGGAAPDEKVAAFEKDTAGTWLSECQQDQDGFFKDTLVINGGKGTFQIDYFQNQNCGGQVAKKQEATEFTYTASEKVNGATKITMAIAGKQIAMTVTTNGNQMTVNYDNNKTVRYTRINQAPAPGNGQQGGGDGIVGAWVSEQCSNGEQGGSYVEVLQFKADGQGSALLNIYQVQNCGGEAQGQNPTQFTYKMNANGGGQITINNKNLDFTLQGKRLTIGQFAYKKIQ